MDNQVHPPASFFAAHMQLTRLALTPTVWVHIYTSSVKCFHHAKTKKIHRLYMQCH